MIFFGGGGGSSPAVCTISTLSLVDMVSYAVCEMKEGILI